MYTEATGWRITPKSFLPFSRIQIRYESKIFSSIFPSSLLGNPSHHLHREDLRPPFLLAWLIAASSYLTSSSTPVSVLTYRSYFCQTVLKPTFLICLSGVWCLSISQHGAVLFLPSFCSTETFFLPVLSYLPFLSQSKSNLHWSQDLSCVVHLPRRWLTWALASFPSSRPLSMLRIPKDFLSPPTKIVPIVSLTQWFWALVVIGHTLNA